MRWDIFISHASEDKENLVKPLAEYLHNHGVQTWYDEFELKIGDSLSNSIDKGLALSSFGLVVLSKHFFEKNWTDYEYRSLLAKEMNGNKTILPIWHGISKKDIIKYSPFLADKFALPTELGIPVLASKIIEVIRPDIVNNNQLGFAVKKIRKNNNLEKKEIPPSQISDGPIVHSKLPLHLLIATPLLAQMFSDIDLGSIEKWIDNFSRDLDYTEEFIIWNTIACSYIIFLQNEKYSFSDLKLKKEILKCLLRFFDGDFNMDDLEVVAPNDYRLLLDIYYDNRIYFQQYHDFNSGV